ncbi:galactokinase [Arthrobacter sp. I2-34]|uniref:Galactokinase n=1 Tax=Arthrobacter hankyongi TaxID=2904801 RepID=A0ABS9L375_9MICC|nr:galactokinase [Arthrobacter hankyongi]MCG2621065.1 galactokinase [Arthrobacter hankyongi]
MADPGPRPAGLADGFARLFGYPPEGIWAGPGRVNLIGEHTDYNAGCVLPFAIDRQSRAALARRTDRTVRLATMLAPRQMVVTDLDAVGTGRAGGWAGYPLGVAWALGRAGVDVPGFDLLVDSTVPVGAGLASSAALECAVAVALAELTGAGLSRQQLAAAGQRAENDVVGAPTGIMDQAASLLGREGAAIFLDCRTGAAEPVPLDLAAADLGCLVIDTKVAHAHAAGGYANRRAACERAASLLGVASLRELAPADLPAARRRLDEAGFRRVRHVVTENDRVRQAVGLLRGPGPLAVGGLLDASHASLRDDFEVSCPELDLAVACARAAGAAGARMTGGGFGGSAIALVPRPLLAAVRQSLAEAFAARGYTAPDTFTVSPSAGARRLS